MQPIQTIIFDFDDTLVDGCLKVPKQTWHLLKWLICNKWTILVVSYNPLLDYYMQCLGLSKYIHFWATAKIDRHELVKRVLDKANLNPDTNFLYADDRQDHLNTIQAHWPHAVTFHCTAIETLHRIKTSCLTKK